MKPIIVKEPQGVQKCHICGKEEDPSYWINESEMREHKMCFSCNFWREMLEKDAKRPSYTWCMIDGIHYVIAPENDKSSFRGFAGAKFQIEFFDGTKVVTTNLWCQGEPNEYWKDKFPNNARFENNLKRTDINGTQYLIEEKA